MTLLCCKLTVVIEVGLGECNLDVGFVGIQFRKFHLLGILFCFKISPSLLVQLISKFYLDDYQIVRAKLIAIEGLQSASNLRQLGESGLFVDELFTVKISKSLTVEANPGKKKSVFLRN